mmetsp:Transcript_28364/g.42888  ORF Transcript_28364/g.42888 Transcript_28364/m.42888 type:complete len:113 (-) Transcript_28364:130-468(-)
MAVTPLTTSPTRIRHKKKPNTLVDQWKCLKVGRKPGVFKYERKKQDRLMPAYMSKKNIVTRGVIWSKFPDKVGSEARNHVNQTAFNISSSDWVGFNHERNGNASSLAIADKT